jgi:F0F1-type ATP synthase gamma subunit
MDSKDLYKELEKDNAAQIILALSKLYNQLRQQRLGRSLSGILAHAL